MKKAGGRVSTTLPSQHAVGHCHAPPPVVRWLTGLVGRACWPAQNPNTPTTQALISAFKGYQRIRSVHANKENYKNCGKSIAGEGHKKKYSSLHIQIVKQSLFLHIHRLRL